MNNALTRSPFWTPLLAMDRLNSWLRADTPTYCHARSVLKRPLYNVKVQAILWASRQWPIGLRRVVVRKSCRRCAGSGIWEPDWVGYCNCCDTAAETRANHGEKCRGCDGTGTATLLFIETTIGPIRWHTPAKAWYMWSLDTYLPYASHWPNGVEYYEPTTWEPNQAGRPLSLDEVHRDMLIVLEAWPHEVCSFIDYQHHAGLEKTYRCPDTTKAKAWLQQLLDPQINWVLANLTAGELQL